jgi:hypothetical protein
MQTIIKKYTQKYLLQILPCAILSPITVKTLQGFSIFVICHNKSVSILEKWKELAMLKSVNMYLDIISKKKVPSLSC